MLGEGDNSTGWVIDYNNRLLGAPRIRQLRVKSGKTDTTCCTVIIIQQNILVQFFRKIRKSRKLTECVF